jgi:hypothetical protein
MIDIVERLRGHPGPDLTVTEQFRILVEQRHEAADQIERQLKALMNLVACCEKLRAFNKPDNILSIGRLAAARAAIAKAEGRD